MRSTHFNHSTRMPSAPISAPGAARHRDPSPVRAQVVDQLRRARRRRCRPRVAARATVNGASARRSASTSSGAQWSRSSSVSAPRSSSSRASAASTTTSLPGPRGEVLGRPPSRSRCAGGRRPRRARRCDGSRAGSSPGRAARCRSRATPRGWCRRGGTARGCVGSHRGLIIALPVTSSAATSTGALSTVTAE